MDSDHTYRLVLAGIDEEIFREQSHLINGTLTLQERELTLFHIDKLNAEREFHIKCYTYYGMKLLYTHNMC